MAMTVNKLHKILGEMIAAGHGRRSVNVAKHTFTHNCESDGVTILEVCTVKAEWFPLSDDDGGGAYRKDGTERGSTCVVLRGASSDPSPSQKIIDAQAGRDAVMTAFLNP